MFYKSTKYLLFFLLLVSSVALSQNKTPDVFSLDPDELISAKELVVSNSSDVMPAYKVLIKAADRFLKKGPYSVMQKEKTPPSGDKHDYLSLSIYSWPNPKTKDGLPYITRDGQVNPDSKIGTDASALVQLCEASFTLALAYYLSGNDKYAEHAADLLRTWFLDPSTKMNPNLTYAQAVMGKNEGSPGGIIDSRNLMNVTEAAGLLEGSKWWTALDKSGLMTWFKNYLSWLLTSANGKTEGETKNNHLTFYKAQVIDYAHYAGDNDVVNNELESVKELIASQIRPDGTQPLELNRTKTFNYSVFNLQAFFLLTEMGKNADVNLYSYQTSDGRSIRGALDFIAPYSDTTKPWPYKEIAPIARENTGSVNCYELHRLDTLMEIMKAC